MIGYCNKTLTIWNIFTLGHHHFKCHSNTTTCLSHKNFSISQDKQSLYMNKGFNLFLWHTLINQENLSWMSITRTFARFIKNSYVGDISTCFFLGSKDGDNIWTAASFFRATTCTTKWQLSEDQNSGLSTLGNAKLGREEGLGNLTKPQQRVS